MTKHDDTPSIENLIQPKILRTKYLTLENNRLYGIALAKVEKIAEMQTAAI